MRRCILRLVPNWRDAFTGALVRKCSGPWNFLRRPLGVSLDTIRYGGLCHHPAGPHLALKIRDIDSKPTVFSRKILDSTHDGSLGSV